MTFLPGIVYGNLVKMMTYRGATLNMAPLDHTSLAHRLNHHETALITGARGATDPRGEALLVFVLVAPGSDIADKSAAFMRVLRDMPKPPATGILEIVVVSETQLTSHIEKKINEYRSNNPTAELESHTYAYWTTEVPINQMVPHHTLPEPGEFEKHCELHYKSPSDFSIIRQREPMGTWLGLKVGMAVKIVRVSETAGTAIAYRYCLPGK